MSAPSASAPSAAIGPIDAAVCNFNGREHLPFCLEALFAQSLPLRQVILVDNASTDGSVEWVQQNYPSVQIERLMQNQGPSPARNRGLELAQSAWVLLVDNDAVLEPDAVLHLARCAAAHPKAALVQPRSVFFDDPARVHYDGGAFHYCGLLALRNFGVQRVKAMGQGEVEVPAAVSVALLARRAALARQQAFDPGYFILFEDLDLSYRLRALGHGIYSAEDAICRHRGGTGGISFRSGDYPRRRTRLHSRNRWRFVLKCYRLRTLLVALPGLLVYELASVVFAATSGTFFAWCLGKWDLLRAMPEIVQQRGAFLAQRRRTCKERGICPLRDRDLLVAGPLTVHPGVESRAVRWLSRALATWWNWTKRLAG